MAKFSLSLLAIFLATLPLRAAPNGWDKLENCRLVHNAYADGDSFHVMAGSKELIVRLYFVDCPESDDSIPSRVAEQASHFGKNTEETIHVGKYAAQVTAQLLSRRFTVLTKYEDARGRSSMPRYYAFVTTSDGQDLGEILTDNGLARSYGMPASPPGHSASSLKSKYDRLEARAKHAKYGIYSPEPLKAIARAQAAPTPSPLEQYMASKDSPTTSPETAATQSTTPSVFAGFEEDLGTRSATPSASPQPQIVPQIHPGDTAPVSNGGPKNHMKSWTREEEQQLRSEVKAGKSVNEIATAHGRTTGAITARIKKLELDQKPKTNP